MTRGPAFGRRARRLQIVLRPLPRLVMPAPVRRIHRLLPLHVRQDLG